MPIEIKEEKYENNVERLFKTVNYKTMDQVV